MENRISYAEAMKAKSLLIKYLNQELKIDWDKAKNGHRYSPEIAHYIQCRIHSKNYI